MQQVSNRCAKEFTNTCSENGGALRNSQDIEINPYRARFPRYTYWCDLTKESKEWLNMNDRLKLTHHYRPTTLKSFSWLHNGKSNQAVFTNMRPNKKLLIWLWWRHPLRFSKPQLPTAFFRTILPWPEQSHDWIVFSNKLRICNIAALTFFLIPVIRWLIFIQYSMEKHLSKGY